MRNTSLEEGIQIMTTFKVTQLRVVEIFFVKNMGRGVVWLTALKSGLPFGFLKGEVSRIWSFRYCLPEIK